MKLSCHWVWWGPPSPRVIAIPPFLCSLDPLRTAVIFNEEQATIFSSLRLQKCGVGSQKSSTQLPPHLLTYPPPPRGTTACSQFKQLQLRDICDAFATQFVWTRWRTARQISSSSSSSLRRSHTACRTAATAHRPPSAVAVVPFASSKN